MALPNRVSKGVVSRLIRRVVIGVGGFTGGSDCEIIVWNNEVLVWQGETICWGVAA